MSSADGTKIEEYYRNGNRDRADGPAYVETRANGSRIEKYFHDGKLDRADGPAHVQRFADGTRIEESYREDKFIKSEILAALTAIRGVKILNASPPRPTP